MPSILNATTTNGLVTSADNSGSLQLQTNNGTTAVTIDTSQNVGIGTASPSRNVSIFGTNAALTIQNSTTGSTVNDGLVLQQIGNDSYLWNLENSFISIGTNNAERMRITSGGSLLVGTTSTDANSNPGIKLNASATAAAVAVVNNTAGDNNTYLYFNTNATNNGYRFYVNINGGIYNYSGNNSNLSDERTKENIELAGSYLSKICSIPVKVFNYKDEPAGEQKTLGVIAQDVETIAPELVNNKGFGETKEGEEPLKSIYTTDMMFAMMKAIQELKAELDATKAEVQALKGVK